MLPSVSLVCIAMILIESCFISFREINLNLSTVMWQQLQEASIVKDFHSFQLQVRSVEDKNETFEESCAWSTNISFQRPTL